MNNTVENDFFGFPKVKWLQYTGKVGNVQALVVKLPFGLFSLITGHRRIQDFLWKAIFPSKKLTTFF